MERNGSRSMLDKLSSMVGKQNRLGKLLSGYQKLREANYISQHFSSYLTPVLAENDALRSEAYRIRHNVYCEELNFEPVREDQQEKDDFDAYSLHSLIRHAGTGAYAGTVRVVRPQEPGQLLPIEKYCLNSITDKELNPSNFDRNDVCEVSRLAVPKDFRRRQADQFQGAATGVINQATYSETELRCFPFIAIGLYFSAAALIVNRNIAHSYVMMEPRLARSMSFVGIKFKQLGPVVDYHGKRAPYYINPSLLYANLSPSFRLMLERIEEALEKSASY
ncbi:PEP-CTERM/exosortase system-associated acyltransferase [Alteromonas sp. CYL-A6]|uniref:PEP-CTERM/exosortase system-associated acyltransferase n=1 Tax=Alteromonas nitratireducens TaxID=3390813 RepID=UPI0034B2AA3A